MKLNCNKIIHKSVELYIITNKLTVIYLKHNNLIIKIYIKHNTLCVIITLMFCLMQLQNLYYLGVPIQDCLL